MVLYFGGKKVVDFLFTAKHSKKICLSDKFGANFILAFTAIFHV